MEKDRRAKSQSEDGEFQSERLKNRRATTAGRDSEAQRPELTLPHDTLKTVILLTAGTRISYCGKLTRNETIGNGMAKEPNNAPTTGRRTCCG